MEAHHEAGVDGQASWQHPAISDSGPGAREAVGGVLERVVDFPQEAAAALGRRPPEGEETGAGEPQGGAGLADRMEADMRMDPTLETEGSRRVGV